MGRLTRRSTDLLSTRALNRALLRRQGLLARSSRPAAEMVEQLVGVQAQVPCNLDVPLPDPETPTPPRLLPECDDGVIVEYGSELC